MGYNLKEDLHYLGFDIMLLTKVAKILENQWFEENSSPPGGRVFIDLSGVVKKDRYGREVRLYMDLAFIGVIALQRVGNLCHSGKGS